MNIIRSLFPGKGIKFQHSIQKCFDAKNTHTTIYRLTIYIRELEASRRRMQLYYDYFFEPFSYEMQKCKYISF